MTTSKPQDRPGSPLARVREELVARLSLAPDSSSAHTVAPYGDGLRFTLTRTVSDAPIYTYALPWARGWTVFTSHRDNATNYDWHLNSGYSQRVANPRDVVGAQNTPIDKLIDAIYDAIDYMDYHYGIRPEQNEDNELAPDGAIEADDYFDGEDGGPEDCVFYGHP